MHYFYCSLAELHEPLRELQTFKDSPLKYCKITIDKHERVVAMTYLGNKRINASDLKQVIGLPIEAFNCLDTRCSSGDIEDIVAFLNEDWAQALYHDRYMDFLHALMKSMENDTGIMDVKAAIQEGIDIGEKYSDLALRRRSVIGVGGSSIPPETKKTIESALLAFLRNNRNMLPKYYIPGSSVSL